MRTMTIFPCPLCDFGTNSAGEYYSHIRRKHPKTMEPDENTKAVRS